jgi:hypothetical protein
LFEKKTKKKGYQWQPLIGQHPPSLSLIEFQKNKKTLILFACTIVLFDKLSKVFNPCANVEKKNSQDRISRKIIKNN